MTAFHASAGRSMQAQGGGTAAPRRRSWNRILPVNVVALVYGLGAIIDMVWPRTPASPWYVNYAMGATWLAIIGIGGLYMVLARPYQAGDAPAGDAWKLAKV